MSAEPKSQPAARSIVRTSGTCGGRPRLQGTRIRVRDVVHFYRDAGMSPADIAVDFPSITEADVAAAMAYYRAHAQEIDEDIAGDEQRFAEFAARHPELVLDLRG